MRPIGRIGPIVTGKSKYDAVRSGNSHQELRAEMNSSNMPNIRPYLPDDKAACATIFAGNVPGFFLEHETARFTDFLERLPCPFFVIEQGKAIVACGGYFVDPANGNARLVWGMVERRHHREGIGRYLLQARLAALAGDPQAQRVVVNTSQHSSGFFERAGFKIKEIVPDFFGTSMHRHTLELVLDDVCRKWIEERGRVSAMRNPDPQNNTGSEPTPLLEPGDLTQPQLPPRTAISASGGMGIVRRPRPV
jgi:N-acetylglutamate synthase-like GNAT family acetyltransferase